MRSKRRNVYFDRDQHPESHTVVHVPGSGRLDRSVMARTAGDRLDFGAPLCCERAHAHKPTSSGSINKHNSEYDNGSDRNGGEYDDGANDATPRTG